MVANKIVDGASYIENAILAQHDGFPSRLLDVSYNCLVALYFASTPYYYKAEDAEDAEDGVVYIYYINEMFCPVGNNIVETYNSIIEMDKGHFIESEIFKKNHKLIDHIKISNRIIAQQGAFILFQGDSVSTITKYKRDYIVIDAEYKARIREELNRLFGIHTGSIYPEATNLVKQMVNKSSFTQAEEFTLDSEMKLIIKNVKFEVQSYYKEIIACREMADCIKIIERLEKEIYSYKIGLEELIEKGILPATEWTDKKGYTAEYNDIIEYYIKKINMVTDIDINITELLVK